MTENGGRQNLLLAGAVELNALVQGALAVAKHKLYKFPNYAKHEHFTLSALNFKWRHRFQTGGISITIRAVINSEDCYHQYRK